MNGELSFPFGEDRMPKNTSCRSDCVQAKEQGSISTLVRASLTKRLRTSERARKHPKQSHVLLKETCAGERARKEI